MIHERGECPDCERVDEHCECRVNFNAKGTVKASRDGGITWPIKFRNGLTKLFRVGGSK